MLKKRFAKYGLTLHPEKTPLIEFGRNALAKSEETGGPKPATFDFLGFTPICKRTRRGKFTIHVHTMRKRLRRSLKAVTAWCREHRHDPVEEQQEALNRKLRGHYPYYGRSSNSRGIGECPPHLAEMAQSEDAWQHPELDCLHGTFEAASVASPSSVPSLETGPASVSSV